MLAHLVPLQRHDLVPGVPLPFALFDQEKRLVCGEGEVIATAEGIDDLMERGIYRAAANEGAAETVHDPVPPANGEGCAFEELQFQVGDALQLQALAGQDLYYVNLIGYAPRASILVSMPTLRERMPLVREGQGFLARAFSGRAAFTFNTTVQRICNVPYPYLHLSFPELVQGVSVRHEPRIRLRMMASATSLSAHGVPVPVTITDLSASGAQIDAREQLAGKRGMLRLTFRLRLGQEEAYFVNDAIVCSVREENRGGEGGEPVFLHGVEFIGIQPNERLLLKTLIGQHVAEGRR